MAVSGGVTSEVFLGTFCSRLCCVCVEIYSQGNFFLKLCLVTQKSLICTPTLILLNVSESIRVTAVGDGIYTLWNSTFLSWLFHTYTVCFLKKQRSSPFISLGGCERLQETLS